MIVIWFLGYFPQHTERKSQFDAQVVQVERLYTDNHISTNEKLEKLTIIQQEHRIEHQANSYIGRLGHFIEPVMRPLGFDWKVSVALLTGLAAKEIVVSTMGVLYLGEDIDYDSEDDRASHAYQFSNLTEREVHTNSADLRYWQANNVNYLDAGTFGMELYSQQPLEVDARYFAEEVLKQFNNKIV